MKNILIYIVHMYICASVLFELSVWAKWFSRALFARKNNNKYFIVDIGVKKYSKYILYRGKL